MERGVVLQPASSVPQRGPGGAVLFVRLEGGQVKEDGTLDRRPVIVRLVDGPCEGQHAKVLGYGKDCWQKMPGNQHWWAKYSRSAQGEYSFTGDIIDHVGMAAMIAKAGRGNVAGSHGA